MKTFYSDELDTRTRRTTVSHPFGEDGRLVSPEIQEEIVNPEDEELSPAEHVLAEHLIPVGGKGGTASAPRAPKQSKLRTPRRKKAK